MATGYPPFNEASTALPGPPMPVDGESRGGAGNVGGVLPVRTAAAVIAEDEREARLRASEANSAPVLQALAGHMRSAWADAKDARNEVTRDMVEAARAADGRYPPDMEAQLAAQGDSVVYMMLFASKKRAFTALVTDVLDGAGASKPWGLTPTPVPDLPDDVQESIFQETFTMAAQAEMSGQPMSVLDIAQLLRDAKEKADNAIMAEAKARVKREETLMEDLLTEGGFHAEFRQFVDDLAVYPTAFMKGPVVRNVGQLKWIQAEEGFQPQVVKDLRPQWERVDPMRLYPSRGARDIQDGYLVEVHDLSIADLDDLRGVEGYSEDAIKAVIEENAEGKLMSKWATYGGDRDGMDRPGEERVAQTVEALQFWGAVPGHMLRQWGMDDSEVPDPNDRYEIEAWLIDNWVIKAVINTDPLQMRPYFACSFDRVPGRVWGRSVYHAMKDCQMMCNAAARALDVNMGLSSGPQVGVNVDRMPAGESITSMFPWKVWQFGNDPTGSNSSPIEFFQPNSNANELMGVYEKFSQLADEYTGIPRYMTGQSEGMGGAARTASGMSMMIGNASKTIKSMIGDIDKFTMYPLIMALHVYIMRFHEDESVKGDINIVPRGAQFLATREAAQLRRNEFLQITANPIDQQIVGVEGRAAILREVAKTLDMDVDTVVPSISEIKQRMAVAAAQAQAGAEITAQAQQQDQTQLQDGAPVTQNFDQVAG